MDFPLELAGNLGATGLVGIFIVAILLGKLVPRSTVDNGQALFELRVAEAKAEAAVWREAYGQSESARSVLAEQARTSVEVSETLARLLERVAPESLPRKGGTPE